MWCYIKQRECYKNYCDGFCNDLLYYPQQFNYECPDCHGKFNSPVQPAVGNTCLFKCPFCGRPMEGMNG